MLSLLSEILLTRLEAPAISGGGEGKDIDLNILKPLHELALDCWDRTEAEGRLWSVASRLSRSLTDLFYLVEKLALKRNVTVEWLLGMLNSDHMIRIVKTVGRGFYNVGALGEGIGMPNVASLAIRSVVENAKNELPGMSGFFLPPNLLQTS